MSLQSERFTVGWICAVEIEFVIACELLDEEYTQDQRPRLHPQDTNSYHFGRIHEHNVAIACLPKGRYGNTSATSVAIHMVHSFPAIRIGLMVGIGAGAPSPKHDIRLGDIVVSSPTPRHGGVVQYDYGKAIQEQEFEETGYLTQPPQVLLTALSYLSAQHKRKGHQINKTISTMLAKNKRIARDYSRPSPECDMLFDPSFLHTVSCPCLCSDRTSAIERKPRGEDEDDPVVRYGLVASANTLLKDAQLRDRLAKKHDILCFEMEAAGLMDNFPCVVIRGICDYADTHKNDQWRGYAAATAAAYAKELLGVIPGTEIRTTSPVVHDKELLHQSRTKLATHAVEDDQQALIRSPLQSSRSVADSQPITKEYSNIPESRLIVESSRSLDISVTAVSNTTIESSKGQLFWEPDLVSVDVFLSSKQYGLLKLDIAKTYADRMTSEADGYLQRKWYNRAIRVCTGALTMNGDHTERQHLFWCLLKRKLGDIYFEKNEIELAIQNYHETWSRFPDKHRCVDALETAERLALAQARQNQHGRAAELLEYVLDLRRKHLGICHPSVSTITEALAASLDKLQKYAEAADLYRWLWLTYYFETGRNDGNHYVIGVLAYYLKEARLTSQCEALRISEVVYFMDWVLPLAVGVDTQHRYILRS